MKLIVSISDAGGAWEAQLLQPKTRTVALDPNTNAPFLAQARRLEQVKTKAGVFPLPPIAERAAISAFDLDLIASHFQKTVAQSIQTEEMKVFGSYLFHTLIGEPLWRQLLAAAGGDEIELVLSWNPKLAELTRLPWEMMFGANDFLVAESRLVIAREVAGTSGALRDINSPPRVLFVMGSEGSEGNFDELKPGAEYFGLLRSVRKSGLGLNIWPLIAVTLDKLAIAMRRFRPDVVHFVCHGNPDGTLELLDPKQVGTRVKVDAENLYRTLFPRNDAGGYAGPQVIVLNSCHSASSGGVRLEDAGQVNFPLAISLVQLGVPVVLGMAGEIANQACRLFSYTFYRSLLSNGMLPQAAAKGRYAALTSVEGKTQRRLDWALPTLFMSPAAAEDQLNIVPNPVEYALQELAEVLAPEEFRGYYARLDLLRLSGVLMLDESDQRDVDPTVRKDRQFLGISTSTMTGGKLGRSWALRDLAGLGARNGHIPLVLEKGFLGKPTPLTAEDFADFLKSAARVTLTQLKNSAKTLPWDNFRWAQTDEVLKLGPGQVPGPSMAPEVSELHVRGDANERLDMLAAAIRLDLVSLLDVISTALGRPNTRMALIIDDVHRMGDAANFLFKRLFGNDCLRQEREKIRAVFALAQEPECDDQISAIEAARECLERSWTSHYKMAVFREPTETRLAYEHFLLNWKDEGTPYTLVPATENAALVKWLFITLHNTVKGIPSNLRSGDTVACLRAARSLPPPQIAVRDATDEELLSKLL